MNLNNTFRKIAILLLLVLNLTVNGQTKNYINSPEYIIQIDKDTRNIAKIEANLILNDSTIRMAAWGHPWLKHGWATFVKKLEIKTESGQTLSYSTVDKDGWGKWKKIVEEPSSESQGISSLVIVLVVLPCFIYGLWLLRKVNPESLLLSSEH